MKIIMSLESLIHKSHPLYPNALRLDWLKGKEWVSDFCWNHKITVHSLDPKPHTYVDLLWEYIVGCPRAEDFGAAELHNYSQALL